MTWRPPNPERAALRKLNKEDPDGEKAQRLDRLREAARQRTNARLRQQADAQRKQPTS